MMAAAAYLIPLSMVGVADLSAMGLWSVVFAGIVFLAARVLHVGTRVWATWRSYLLAVVIGPTLGLGCFAALAVARGGWTVAFPVFVCWAFGGAIGLLAGAVRVQPRSWPIAAALSIAMVGGLLWAHSVLRRLG